MFIGLRLERTCFAEIISEFLFGVKEKVQTRFEKKEGEYDMDEESWSMILLYNSHCHVSNLIKKFAKFILIFK